MAFLLVVIYITFISLGLPDSLFGVAWPVVHIELGVPESMASIFMILVALTTGGVSFFAGRAIRKFGTGKITFASVLLTAIGLIGISFSTVIYQMILSSIVLGLGAGAIDTGLNNFVSLHYKASHMNWLHCFWGVGVTISPLIMSYFMDNGVWRDGYRAIAYIQLAIAFLVFLSLGKWKKAEKTIVNTSVVKKEKINVFKIKGVVFAIISLGLYTSMEFLVGTWGASFLVNTRACEPALAAQWISLYYGGIMIGRFISGFLSYKINDKWLIRIGIVISLSGIIVLAIPIGIFSMAGLLMIGIGFGPVFPSFLHAAPVRFGIEYSADITGYQMGGSYVIGFGMQLIFGYTATATTFEIMPYIMMILAVLLLIFSEITNKKTSKHMESGLS